MCTAALHMYTYNEYNTIDSSMLMLQYIVLIWGIIVEETLFTKEFEM